MAAEAVLDVITGKVRSLHESHEAAEDRLFAANMRGGNVEYVLYIRS